ncbi:hypothetical protein GCM10010319_52420 [Streptomyces blastmyceticus]|uniref:Uncharacterized protein n=1 Tax=Streptomyces blastmyceticus TaxID=68180 RepID=A0ABN0XMJ2_9ACTN
MGGGRGEAVGELGQYGESAFGCGDGRERGKARLHPYLRPPCLCDHLGRSRAPWRPDTAARVSRKPGPGAGRARGGPRGFDGG